MRRRWSWTKLLLIASVVIALGLGGAGLGLALTQRLGDVDRVTAAAVRHDADRGQAGREEQRNDRVESRRSAPSPRFSPPSFAIGDFMGSQSVRGTVVAIDDDSVLIETANGERRRVYGTLDQRERFEASRDAGDEITVAVTAGLDGRLRLRGVREAGARPAPAIVSQRVIAIGEVTAIDDTSISVTTILGNDIDVALRDATQASGIAVGDTVAVFAERDGDTLRARSITSMGHLFDGEHTRAFGLAPATRNLPRV